MREIYFTKNGAKFNHNYKLNANIDLKSPRRETLQL
jgi:hypothetical protein